MEDLLLSKNLNEEEKAKIISVLRKEQEVRAQEENYIRELKKKLETLKKSSLTSDEEKLRPYACFRCSQDSSSIYLFFFPFSTCYMCSKKICKNCSITVDPTRFICVYCDTVKTIQGISGSWFLEDKNDEPVKTSIKLQEYQPSPRDLDETMTTDVIQDKQRSASSSESASSEACAFQERSILGYESYEHKRDDTVTTEEEIHLDISPFKQEVEFKPVLITETDLYEDQQKVDSPKYFAPISEKESHEDSSQFVLPPLLSSINTVSAASATEENVPLQEVLQTLTEIVEEDLKSVEEERKILPEVGIPEIHITSREGSERILADQSEQSKSLSQSTPSLVPEIAIVEKKLEHAGSSTMLHSTDSMAFNGQLHGKIKIEKVSDSYKIKLKVIDATGLKPIGASSTVSSYVVCQITSNHSVVFKKKSSTVEDCSAPIWDETFEFVFSPADFQNLLIFLLIRKPPKHTFKSVLKKEAVENNIYGSVRIGSANYLSPQEKEVWLKLKEFCDGSNTNWVDFKIDLKRVDTEEMGSQILNDASASNLQLDLSSSQRDISNTADDSISYASVSSKYYNYEAFSGFLKVYLKYSPPENSLFVTISQAEALPLPQRVSSSAKIFGKCKIIPKNSQNDTKTTIIKKICTDPEFNSTFIFNLNPTALDDTCLVINLFRSEKILTKTFSGQVLVPVGTIVQSNDSQITEGYTHRYQLTSKVPNGKSGFKGIISVSIRYEPVSYDGQFVNLEVRVPKINDLRHGEKNTPPDSQVVCCLLPDMDKKSRKTSRFIKKCADPEYKFSFSYQNINLTDLRLSRCLEITVWSNNSKFIGGVRIGTNLIDSYSEYWQDSSEAESKLWTQMFEKPKEWIFGSLPLRYTMISQTTYPMLKRKILDIYSSTTTKTGMLTLTMSYMQNPNPHFVINIEKTEGMSVGGSRLSCKVSLYSDGEIVKDTSQCFEQTSDNYWNKNVTFDLQSSVESSGVEFRIKKEESSKSSNVNLKGDVIGMIFLSKGVCHNELYPPTQEEIAFFNKVIDEPNKEHHISLRIKPYGKNKSISRKTDKKFMTKVGGSSLAMNVKGSQTVRSSINLATEEGGETSKKTKGSRLLRKQPSLKAVFGVKNLIRSRASVDHSMDAMESTRISQDKDIDANLSLISAPDKNIETTRIDSVDLSHATDKKPEMEATTGELAKPDLDVTPIVALEPEISGLEKIEENIAEPQLTPESAQKVEESDKVEKVETHVPELSIQSSKIIDSTIKEEQVIRPEQKDEIKLETNEIKGPLPLSDSIAEKEQMISPEQIIETRLETSEIMEPLIDTTAVEVSVPSELQEPPLPQKEEETQKEKAEDVMDEKVVTPVNIPEPAKDETVEALPDIQPVTHETEAIKIESQLPRAEEVPSQLLNISETDAGTSRQSEDFPPEEDFEEATDFNIDETPKSSENASNYPSQTDSTEIGTGENTGSRKLFSSASVKPRRSVKSRHSVFSKSFKMQAGDDSVSTALSLYTTNPVTGQILIGFKYIEIRRQLTISIKSATDITRHDQKKDKNDAFVKVHIFPGQDKNSKFMTKVIKGTLAPVWNENFTYTSNVADLKLRKVIVTVYHKSLAKRVFLGQVIIPMDETLNEVIKKGYLENQYPLSEKVKLSEISTDYRGIGELKLSLMLEPNINFAKKSKSTDKRINIKVIEAKNVASVVPVSKAICKLYFQSDKSNEEKKSTAAAENKSGNYSWNETVVFDALMEKLNDSGILIKVCDSKKTNHVIGSIQLNNGSNKYSWQQAYPNESDIWKELLNNNGQYVDYTFNLRPPST